MEYEFTCGTSQRLCLGNRFVPKERFRWATFETELRILFQPGPILYLLKFARTADRAMRMRHRELPSPPFSPERNTMNLYDQNGQRKYLTPTERQNFIRASESALKHVRTFCGTLVHTGCRISEALALTADRVDIDDGVVIIESLKKRRRGVYRAVPVPPQFLDELNHVHDITAARRAEDGGRNMRLWPWSRPTAWRRVCTVMEMAGIEGLHATPKGLRHGFGIKAVVSNVPLNMTQKWLGHAQLSTTAIYADATGPEEKQIAERMWA
jgi:integrase/recombinase XerD